MTELAADDFPLLDVMWTMFVFFMWVIWVWLLITIFSDLFRRKDVSGWGKAGWTLALIVLPFIGVFVYLISQGENMQDRRVADERALIESRGYVPAQSANGHAASEISEAKHLLDDGAITAEEFNVLKQKALAG